MKLRYRNVLFFLNCSALIVVNRRQAEAVFLNLFMTNPVQVDTDATVDAPSTDDRRSLDQVLAPADSRNNNDRLKSHPKDVRGASTLGERDANARRSQLVSAGGRLSDHGGSHSNCNEDRECQLGMYCDRHYGLCKPYRTMGQLCRRDAQCAIGYDCMFGRCLVAPKPGHRGARCVHDRDCLPGLCCARQHGEKICKPKLKLGQNCFVPEGGLPYWGNDMCPCDKGLLCRYTGLEDSTSSTESPPEDSSKESRSLVSDDWFNLWTDQNQMRCVQS